MMRRSADTPETMRNVLLRITSKKPRVLVPVEQIINRSMIYLYIYIDVHNIFVFGNSFHKKNGEYLF